MEFTIDQIVNILGGEVDGDGKTKVNSLNKLQSAQPGSLSFLSNPKYEKFLYDTEATAVLVERSFKAQKPVHPMLIRVDDPYLGFTILLEELHRRISFQKTGVEEPSFIGEKSITGKNVYRGAFSYIGKNVQIGDNVKIYPHCFLGDNVVVGDHTILHPGAKIYSRCIIGSHCVIHAGVVVGSDGFGFAPKSDGSYQTIPQMGNVWIGDHVHVGANTTIDCSTMEGDSTVISEGVKLDNLIQVAHNVNVGKNTVIAAQTGIAGSTKVGQNCVIGGQVGMAGHIEIGDYVQIGAQAGIQKSVGAENKLTGSPAFDVRKFLSSYAVFKKLPELNRRLRDLDEKILNLPTVQENAEE